jgi:diaminopimelate epimerase
VSRLKFVKAHACGNDFLVIEESAPEWRRGKEHAKLARKLCARHTGIGADGIEYLERRPDGSFFLRLFNADGSEAELSGNGTRCVAAWLAESEGLEEVALGTHGGVRRCKLILKERETPYLIESGMGVPRVMPRRIEVAGVQGAIDGAMVNVGNPHYVIFVETADFSAHGISWQELGAKISVDPLFRFGTNVEFVRVQDESQIEFRIFERGCGPTTSSGTGTCASSAAAMVVKGVAREISALAEGGGQRVVWPANDAEMMLTGPAEIVCVGEAEVDFEQFL